MKSKEIASLVFRIINSKLEVVFLVGSALVAPEKHRQRGVPGAAGMIALMKENIRGVGRTAVEEAGANGVANAYQAAFEALSRHAGQDACNTVIQQAVMRARLRSPRQKSLDAQFLQKLEADLDGWVLSRGVKALGEILCHYGDRVGRTVLTTNFDPLIEVSVRKSGGDCFSTSLHGDGDIYASSGTVPHIIHLHGYWRGSDTLHTPAQLTRPRPLLGNSLRHFLNGKLLAVLGYGGWEDVFTTNLLATLGDNHASPEIVWAFYQESFEEVSRINPWFAERIRPHLGHRVHPFYGVNMHDALLLIGAAAREKLSSSEAESELFWFMAETYIRGFLGDPKLIERFESKLVPGARESARDHVCDSLKITPKIVRAVGELIEGDLDRRTSVVLMTLRLRKMVDEETDIQKPSVSDSGFRAVMRDMFFGKRFDWET